MALGGSRGEAVLAEPSVLVPAGLPHGNGEGLCWNYAGLSTGIRFRVGRASRVIGGGLTNMIQRKQVSLKEAICTGRRANRQRISSREVKHQQRDDPKGN